jgi:hypothetical protein
MKFATSGDKLKHDRKECFKLARVANYLFARVLYNVLQYIWPFKVSTYARKLLILARVRESSTICTVKIFFFKQIRYSTAHIIMQLVLVSRSLTHRNPIQMRYSLACIRIGGPAQPPSGFC